ncbi:MerR family transcriptional regulator [Amycolatopsis sp. NEAU-NG30]|uniref:MerR family transcriptional regulator n=1 Tax=Amycolatopsis melonis TaxID=3156488 RepID=A0ABV0LSW3_9PSEU
MARLFGLTVSTLRYWEERGLVSAAERRGGRRWYGAAELHRIGLIQMWQDTGRMSLDEISLLLDGGGDGAWRDVVLDRLQAIDEQIERLQAGRLHLTHLLNCPCGNPASECEYLRETVVRRMAGHPVTPEELPRPRT